jgi:transcriptional regulator with GAF, ATPase, and Fis domain
MRGGQQSSPGRTDPVVRETGDPLRSDFEYRVAVIASCLANASIADLDEAVVDGLSQVVDVLELDWSAVWRIVPPGGELIRTHVWTQPGSPGLDQLSAATLTPRQCAQIRRNQPVWDHAARCDPFDPARNAPWSARIPARAIVPMSLGGHVTGAIAFGSFQPSTRWSPALRDRLVLIAAILSQAMGRAPQDRQPGLALHDVERAHIRRVLERTGWRIRGAGGAAELLALKPTTLESRMGKLGIHRPMRAADPPPAG